MPIKKPKNKKMVTGDEVVLPVLWGIKPKLYLPILYGAALVILLFLIFLLPGFLNPGGILQVDSEPRGAAVYIDGVYRGTTPCGAAALRGLRTVEISLPGFSSYKKELMVSGRILGSLMAPERIPLFGELKTEDPPGTFMKSAAEYAAWSFAGEPTPTYQIPQVLSEGAYRAGPGASDPAALERMNGILSGSLRFAVTRAGLRDIIRAKFLLDNGGNAPSPLTALKSIRDILETLSETPEAAVWLGDLLPPDTASDLVESLWFAKLYEEPSIMGENPRPYSQNAALRRVSAGGMVFQELPGGSFIETANFPRRVFTESFFLANTEVTRESWDRFLQENPEWSAENREDLERRGLVTPDYLIRLPEAGLEGVPGASWNAAKAYCQWLSAQLPLDMRNDYEARLPLEREWEYAARLVQEGMAENLEGLAGGGWEWCEDPYAPLLIFSTTREIIQGISSPERSLRGGSWINPAGSVVPGTRGSLPPDFCSPFVSFRPAIARKRGAE